MAEEFVTVAVVENAVEASVLDAELDRRDIPHLIVEHHDTAYDGLFQTARGWGRVEAPAERREEVGRVLREIRRTR